jgi:hypothetical protein
MPRSGSGHHSMATMAPLTSSPYLAQTPQSHVPRMATEPPHQYSSTISPTPRIPGNFSAPASPDDVKLPVTDADMDRWFENGNFGDTSYGTCLPTESAVDPMLSPYALPYNEACEASENSNMLYHRLSDLVNLSDIEGPTLDGMATGSTLSLSEDWWRTHLGVLESSSGARQG